MPLISLLPDSPERLATYERALYFGVFLFAILGALCAYAGKQVGAYRGRIEQRAIEEELKRAKEDLTGTRSELSGTRSELANTRSELSELSTKNKQVEQQAAEAQRRADEARQRAMEIEKQQAPRKLSDAQRLVIVTEAKKSAPAALNVVRLGDAEAAAFANDLIAAFQESGWTVGVSNVGTMSPPRYGVTYLAGPTGTMTPREALLLAAMKRAGIVVAVETPGGRFAPGLLVGLKPVAP